MRNNQIEVSDATLLLALSPGKREFFKLILSRLVRVELLVDMLRGSLINHEYMSSSVPGFTRILTL